MSADFSSVLRNHSAAAYIDGKWTIISLSAKLHIIKFDYLIIYMKDKDSRYESRITESDKEISGTQ